MLNLSNALESMAERVPDRTAVVCGARRMTYAEVDAAAGRLAAGLAARGIGPGAIVALACPNIPAFPIAYFAILKTGATVLPISLLLKRDEITYMLTHSEAAAFLCYEGAEGVPIGGEGKAAFDRVASCRLFAWIQAAGDADEVDGVPTLAGLADRSGPPLEAAQRAADDTAVVVYTSGTTGRPKGAELTHANLLFHALVIRQTSEWKDDEVLLVALPLFHIYGQVCQMVAGFAAGATLVLLPRFDPGTVLDLIGRESVTRFAGVPTMYWALLNHAESRSESGMAALATLRTANSGGASLPVEILRRYDDDLGVPLREGYGLSECSPAVTTHHPGRPRKPGSVGTPLWGVQVRLVDDDGRAVATGQRGEVVVRGHCVMKGYLKDPEATREAFRGGWFHTGDIGEMDEDGYLYIVDRKKEMIIRAGMNVYPREVEELLITHPDVSLAAVIGIPDERVGQEVKAYVVPEPGRQIDPAGLSAWAREHMASYKYPRHVEVREALPMTATGKIWKKALVEETGRGDGR